MTRVLFHLRICLLMLFTSALAAQEHHVVLITVDGFPAYSFFDPKTSIPNIRKLAAEGVAAEGMMAANPTVTWPNHTTLVTGVRAGKHSVLYNGLLIRGGAGEPVKVDPRRDKSELVAVETLYDVLSKAGMRTAGINWPCTRNSGTLQDDFPDSPEQLSHTTPRLLKEMIASGILPNEKDATFAAMSGPARDEVWTRAACLVIRERKPHLLLFHLLNTDGTHHRYGPNSPAGYTALALADTFVGRVMNALDEAGIRKNTTVIVTSDHGFAGATNILHPNVLLRQAGLLELDAKNQVVKARAQVIPEGGTGMLYLNDPKTRKEDRERVIELLKEQEGVAEIIEPSGFSAHGYPHPDKNGQMAHLILVPKQGYGISGAATGAQVISHATLQSSLGYHGYLARDTNMNALFVAAGRGIKPGAKLGIIESVDVAPTMAYLLNQKLPNAEGKVLKDILQDSK